MGNSQKTETSEEFKRLELETEIRRDFTEQVHEALSIYLKAMGKRKESVADKSKKLPLEIMAESMIHFGTMLHEDSLYGKALVKFGESHEKIANYQVEYIAGVKDSYVSNLESIVTGMKEYAAHKAKLERRRLDFDAKLNKVHKSRKEKPELEEETRVAQAKYEESLTDTTAKMIELNSNEDEQLEDLLRFMDAEAEYHRKSLDTITSLQRALAEYVLLDRAKSREFRETTLSVAACRPSSEQVWKTYRRGTEVSTALVCKRNSNSNGQRALIHLSVRKGEVVNVICEIDDGWWEGEILGAGRIGMFPSNYVEAVSAEPPPFPVRADLSITGPDLTAEPEYHDDYHDTNGTSQHPNDYDAQDEEEHIPARPHSDINFSPTSISQQRPQDRPFSHISRMSFVPTNAPIPATQQLGDPFSVRRPSSNYVGAGGGGGGGGPGSAPPAAIPASPASRKSSVAAAVAAAPTAVTGVFAVPTRRAKSFYLSDAMLPIARYTAGSRLPRLFASAIPSATSSPFAASSARQRPLSTRTVSYPQVKALVASKNAYTLLDVRNPSETSLGVIPTAVVVPLGEIATAFALPAAEFKAQYGFDKPTPRSEREGDDGQIVVYCRSGRRSAAAIEELGRLGYKNTVNYEGSWLDWTAREQESK
ncbi:hypothetical protein HDU86_000621 [Geranomyces michiganensis]|nr:hypothetical protein HDU86_000621 [Geranomyces michiganensis]